MRSSLVRRITDGLVLMSYLALLGPWFSLAGPYFQDDRASGLYWSFSLLFIISFALSEYTRPLLSTREQRSRRHLILAFGVLGLSLSLLLFVLPMGFFQDSRWPIWFFLGAWAWVRGLTLSASERDNHSMQWRLAWGTVVWAGVVLAAVSSGWWEAYASAFVAFAAVWLISSVLATALTRFVELSDRYGEEASARFWPPLLIVLVVACLTLAGLLALTTPGFLFLISVPARLILQLLQWVLVVLAYGLGFLVAGLIWLLRWLISVGEPADFEGPDMGEMPGFEVGETGAWLVPAAEIARWAGAIVVVLLVLGVAAHYLLKSLVREEAEDPEETRESYASTHALSSWARRRWEAFWARAKARARQAAALGFPGITSATRAYHAVLRTAQGQGTVKHRAVTAHRFQPVLKQCFEHAEEALDRVLTAFSLEYYGDRTTTSEQLEGLRSDLKRIQSPPEGESSGSIQEKSPT